ncbi:uncharacterized protein G2W53_012189 [Senna tora]|uniref:Uncharacterized protein n=1 Tax=Senna tora TaxID=362788 RepID=A0A834U0L5_9FABA|nr:uncharacterized protein G2W53_012189 [Senna tora]
MESANKNKGLSHSCKQLLLKADTMAEA